MEKSARQAWMRQAEFDSIILSSGAIGFFADPVEIKKGVFSSFYINWRTVASDAFLLDKVTDLIIDFIGHSALRPSSIYGVPDGATKWGIVSQLKWARLQKDFAQGAYSVPMGRSAPKAHGMPQDRMFVGMPRGPTVIIEDVVVEGEALLNSIRLLRDAKVNVVAAIVLTDRNEKSKGARSVGDEVEAMGIKYFAMSNATELVPAAFSMSGRRGIIAKSIEKEYAERGAAKMPSLGAALQRPCADERKGAGKAN